MDVISQSPSNAARKAAASKSSSSKPTTAKTTNSRNEKRAVNDDTDDDDKVSDEEMNYNEASDSDDNEVLIHWPLFTARAYARTVLGVVILSVRLSVCHMRGL